MASILQQNLQVHFLDRKYSCGNIFHWILFYGSNSQHVSNGSEWRNFGAGANDHFHRHVNVSPGLNMISPTEHMRNNDVVITSKRRHFASKYRRFDVITTSLLCNVPAGLALGKFKTKHYNDVIMTTMASQITSLTVVYSTIYSDADQRKHQSSASLAFVCGIHRDRWIPRTKGQLRRKMFPFYDVIMISTSAVRCFGFVITHKGIITVLLWYKYVSYLVPSINWIHRFYWCFDFNHSFNV